VRFKVPAIIGAVGCVLMTFIALGSTRAATAKTEAAQAARTDAQAKQQEVATRLAALPAAAPAAEVLALCETMDSLGTMPAAHGERCGDAFAAAGRAAHASGNAAEGARLLGMAVRATLSPKQEVVALHAKAKADADRIAAKAKAEADRQQLAALLKEAQGSLKEAQAKLAAADLPAASTAATTARQKTQAAVALSPGDKAAADLAAKLDVVFAKLDKAQKAEAAAKRREGYIKESCAQVSRKFGPGSPLSDLQKEEAWKQYKGKGFAWELEVVEVSEGMLGGYVLQFKCAHNSPSLIQDLQMSLPSSAKDFAMQFRKGYIYEIEGRLNTTSTLLGMSADII
jgi:hypothetical protein